METQQRQGFEAWDQIAAAYKSEFERKKLKESIKPLVRDIAMNYIDRVDVAKQELIEVGLTHFDQALNAYYQRIKRRREAGESTYAFSTYFTWWIRRDIRRHIGIEEQIPAWKQWLLKVRRLVREWKTSILLWIRN